MAVKKVLSMDKFTKNSNYKKAKKTKPRNFIYLFIFFLILFWCQCVFVYLFYIPKILNFYEEFQTVQKHIQIPLERIAFFSVFWPLVFLAFLMSMIFYVRNIKKLTDSIDDYFKEDIKSN